MVTYSYEDLGPERFQELCQALLVQEYPRVTCMPVGMADAGRDAVVSKRGIDVLVFQVKFRRRTPLATTTMTDMLEWLQQAVEPELPKIKRLIAKGMKSYIILTNAICSTNEKGGTRDKMLRWLAEKISAEVDVWWRNDIDRRLDPLWELKRVYGLLESPRASDSLLHAMVGGKLHAGRSAPKPAHAIRVTTVQKFLSMQFERDSVIRFKEADLPRQPLLQSYLDIGADVQLPPDKLQQLVRRSRPLRRTPESREQHYYDPTGYLRPGHFAAAALLLQLSGTDELKSVVVEGAPGQGKSTLVQYVCQVHRARLLGRDAQMRSIPQEYRSSPVLLPFRTDLRDLATWLKGENPFRSEDARLSGYPRSVEGFLAALVSEDSGGSSFTIDDFDELVSETPTLLIFDGLDEVAEVESRTRIVEQISDFNIRLQEVAQELRVVVTSRPSAFSAAPRFPSDRFVYLGLANLNERLIFDYTRTWTKTRGIDSHGTTDLLGILTEKLHEPHIADLARNSMQLAILLWLLYQQADSLPDQRTSLYDQYIKTFLNREAGKSQVIRLHRGIVVQLHAYLAWILQARAESRGSQGNMGIDEIKTLAREYLEALGYSVDSLRVVDELFEQMMDRVGVIVSRVQGSYEFEVQPLREYFAAFHLYETARYSPAGKEVSGTKSDRFDAIARNPYWQNVTRFYVGFFDKGELAHLVAQFGDMFEHDNYSTLSYPRVLAANVLADRVFYQSPGMGQRLATAIASHPIGWLALSEGDGGNMLSIPRDSGGGEIARLGKDLLENVSPSYSGEIMRVLSAHCDRHEIARWWYDRLPPRTADTWNRWMSIGVGLDALQELKDEDAFRIFDPGKCDLLDYGYLFGANLTRLALTNGPICSMLVSYIKSGIWPDMGQWDTDNPLDVACLILFQMTPEAAIEGAQKKFASATRAFPQELMPVIAFNAEVARLRLPRGRFGTYAAGLIEKYFGNCWLLTRHHLQAHVFRGNLTPNADGHFLDNVIDYEGSSFRAIVRSAFDRREDIPWWIHQVSQIRSDDDAQLLLVLLLIFATEPTISACLHLLSPKLSRWTASRALAVFDLVSMLDSRRPRLNAAQVDLSECHPVILASIGMRSRIDQRPHLLDMAAQIVDDPHVREYLVGAILRACQVRMRHTGRWMGCKDIAKRYAISSVNSTVGGYYSRYYDPDSRSIEYSIVEEILRNSSRYPSALVKMADVDGSRELARRVTPIAVTAVQDGWFDQPQPF